ncbi:MAG: hypothetical protein RLZZ496_219 [Pseudomonadota bacterium]|jgi:hypothetical protein|nr:hypothetical protein [Alphaproteobacteria bacterium]
MPTIKRHRRIAVAALGLLVGLSALGGCQRYEWTHPTRSLTDFGRDKLSCEREASRHYPVYPVTTVEGGGYIYGSSRFCNRHRHGFGSCFYDEPIYVPPTYSTRDINEAPRNQMVESCLFSKGYQLVPAK